MNLEGSTFSLAPTLTLSTALIHTWTIPRLSKRHKMRKQSKTQERFEAIYKMKGKKNLADIWDEDRELEPAKVKELNALAQES